MGLTSLPREPSLDCDRYRVVKGPVCDRARGYKTLPGAFIPLRLRSMEHPHPILPLQRFVLDPCPPVEAIRFVLCSCLCVCVCVCVCLPCSSCPFVRVLHVLHVVCVLHVLPISPHSLPRIREDLANPRGHTLSTTMKCDSSMICNMTNINM
jgi:hypothetical protein